MFINPVAERMIGVSREAVVGKNILDIMPDVKESGRYDKYLKVLKTGEPFHIEYMVSHTKFRDIHVGLKAFKAGDWLGLIATDITERKRMEEALRKSEQTIRQLAKASAYAHEEERQRISLEVHDRISQTLTAAFHQMQALQAIPSEDTGAQRILQRALDLLQESIRESRSIMEDLYSPVLSDFGIVAVIDEELRRFREETGCGTKFDKRFAARPTPDVELTAYRIFREVLANIKRHAIGASEVKVSFSCEAGVVSLQVKDNGPGFDAEAAMQNKRVGGLKGMQRRAELGGGTFEVASTPEQGTTVTVRLPYASETSAPDAEKE